MRPSLPSHLFATKIFRRQLCGFIRIFPSSRALQSARFASSQAVGIRLNEIEHLRHPSNTGEVFLVGTSHISDASAQQVHEVTRAVRPTYVVVELCEQRRQRLESERSKKKMGGKAEDINLSGILQSFRIPGADIGGHAFVGTIHAFYKLLRNAGLDPGVDMLAGIDAGRAVGADIICGDVDVEVTAARLRAEAIAIDLPAFLNATAQPEVQADLRAIGLDQHIDIAAVIRGDSAAVKSIAAAAERLKDRGRARRLVKLMDSMAPRLMEALLHQRDAHIAKLLRSPRFASDRTVCVVGMAHMDGIQRRYEDAAWQRDPPFIASPEPGFFQKAMMASQLSSLLGPDVDIKRLMQASAQQMNKPRH